MCRFRNTVCNFVENWNVYNVLCKVENANNVLTYILKIGICYIFDLTDYSIFCIEILYYFLIVFQLNSIIACYVCVQLIKFLCGYIYVV